MKSAAIRYDRSTLGYVYVLCVIVSRSSSAAVSSAASSVSKGSPNS